MQEIGETTRSSQVIAHKAAELHRSKWMQAAWSSSQVWGINIFFFANLE